MRSRMYFKRLRGSRGENRIIVHCSCPVTPREQFISIRAKSPDVIPASAGLSPRAKMPGRGIGPRGVAGKLIARVDLRPRARAYYFRGLSTRLSARSAARPPAKSATAMDLTTHASSKPVIRSKCRARPYRPRINPLLIYYSPSLPSARIGRSSSVVVLRQQRASPSIMPN